jgi:hypothetical protein
MVTISSLSGQPVEQSSLYRRAKLFHQETWGSRCVCHKRDGYPCEACQTQIGLLCDLLDLVMREAIAATERAKARFGY